MNPNYQKIRTITLSGEVKFPGVYSLISKDETVAEVIKRAGGLTEYANPDASILYRDDDTIKIDFSSLLKKVSKLKSLSIGPLSLINLIF